MATKKKRNKQKNNSSLFAFSFFVYVFIFRTFVKEGDATEYERSPSLEQMKFHLKGVNIGLEILSYK